LAGPLPLCEWAIKDSNGSRRAALNSLSAAGFGAPAGPAAFSTGLFGFAALCFFAGFAAGLAAGLAADRSPGFAVACAAGFAVCGAGLVAGAATGLAGACPAGFTGGCAGGFAPACPPDFAAVCPAGVACTAGLAGVCVAGLGGCCAPCPAWSAEFPLVDGSGSLCACKLGAVAAIRSPNPTFIAERIVRSFPLRVFQARCPAWLPQEPHRNQRAW